MNIDKRSLYKGIKITLLAILMHSFLVLANRYIKESDFVRPSKSFYKENFNQDWTGLKEHYSGEYYVLPYQKGEFWIQTNFDGDPSLSDSHQMKELVICGLGAYEAYVNGTLVGVNGKVGDSRLNETSGLLDYQIAFPDSLLNLTSNRVTLRVSNFQDNLSNLDFAVVLRDYHRGVVIKPLILFALAGVFLTVAIYYLFLFVASHRKRSFLIFAVFNIVLFAFIIQSHSRSYWPYLFSQYNTWKWLFSSLSLIAALLLPIFVLENFNVKKKKLHIAISIILVTISHFVFSGDAIASLFISALLATGYNIWAIQHKRTGAWESLVGLAVFLVGAMTFNPSLFIGYAVLVFSNLYSLSIIQQKVKRDHEKSLLRSSRLEAELLKKHLKPHFLMNTLSNIISLIEHQPSLSISLIESLSEEFHQLNVMTSKNLVPIEEEIKLCQSHLKVMRIRNDIDYQFEYHCEPEELLVPPALIHTLMENGISHSEPIDRCVLFKLEIVEQGNEIKIAFNSFGTYEAKSCKNDGTGFMYIKSRLEENYPGRWHLDSSAVGDMQWRTLIKYAP